MKFAANFEPSDDGGFVVTFRDIPEAITQGDTLEEAELMAADALVTAMDFYFDEHRAVPTPSAAQDGERLVGLPPSVTAKVMLMNEMLAQSVTNAELARRLKTNPQTVNRLTDLKHATKIDMLDRAFAALGKRIEISIA